jgi:hypothetical protein
MVSATTEYAKNRRNRPLLNPAPGSKRKIPGVWGQRPQVVATGLRMPTAPKPPLPACCTSHVNAPFPAQFCESGRSSRNWAPPRNRFDEKARSGAGHDLNAQCRQELTPLPRSFIKLNMSEFLLLASSSSTKATRIARHTPILSLIRSSSI